LLNTLTTLSSLSRVSFIPHEPPLIVPKGWQPWDGPLEIPRGRKGVYQTYGDPGIGKVSRKWERANMVVARNLPLIPKGKIYCHRKVEPYIREALRRCSISCPDYAITKFGCFNFRHQRHDPARPLSRHSWGIAVDINPMNNRGIYFKKGKAPEAWSDGWNDKWPKGMPKEFVQAWQSVGWAWGADWDEDGTSVDHTYLDQMHFELVDRS